MDKNLARMHALLKAGLAGAGIQDSTVTYNPNDRSILIGHTGVAVTLERPAAAPARWRVTEVYLFADLTEGGENPIGSTVAEFPVVNDILAARTALLHVLTRRVDSALDAVA